LKRAHARPTATLIQALAVQSHVRHTVAMIVHLAVNAQNLVVHGATVTTQAAVTARLMATAMAQAVATAHTVSVQTDLHTVAITLAMAKTKVLMAVTGRRKATTVGFREAAQLASVGMQAPVVRRKEPGETLLIAITAKAAALATAKTAGAAQHGATAMTAHHVVNGQTKSQLVPVAKTAQAMVVMIGRVATAGLREAAKLASEMGREATIRASKTVRPSEAGVATLATLATATSTAMTANRATLTAQIVPSVTHHARPLSVVHAMLTQTRRHSSKTRCLSA
jgi:hypothetical protein